MSIFIARDFHHFLPNTLLIPYKKYSSLPKKDRQASYIQSWRGGHYVWPLEQRIRRHLEISQKVYVELGEPGMMHQDKNNRWLSTIDFVNRFSKNDNVDFFCNLVPLVPTNRPIHFINDMFLYGHRLYLENSLCKDLLERLKSFRDKKNVKYWDCLLGEKNFKKDFIYEKIKQSKTLLNTTILSYYGANPSEGIWSSYSPKQHSAEVLFKNIRYSDLINLEIYNNSYYTALVETVTHEHFAMFSEKEAKPIMAERPFVIFGSPGHLKALRSLGFKTFSPVIDESYDLELNQEKRFLMVLKSMEKLTKKDPLEVYNSLQTILEHNKKHFLDFNWNSELISSLDKHQ